MVLKPAMLTKHENVVPNGERAGLRRGLGDQAVQQRFVRQRRHLEITT